jgi:hypothetical protein
MKPKRISSSGKRGLSSTERLISASSTRGIKAEPVALDRVASSAAADGGKCDIDACNRSNKICQIHTERRNTVRKVCFRTVGSIRTTGPRSRIPIPDLGDSDHLKTHSCPECARFVHFLQSNKISACTHSSIMRHKALFQLASTPPNIWEPWSQPSQ